MKDALIMMHNFSLSDIILNHDRKAMLTPKFASILLTIPNLRTTTSAQQFDGFSLELIPIHVYKRPDQLVYFTADARLFRAQPRF
ncbi:hypothetical protein TNCT_522071 [Trichonephila clavata]|uniref:Uncharacterized protein n=1 Tax=Trichonephila clavata TaxID=2740835 RepID=A0A8X6G5G5_TRICU|nr:hypothetical protein TNCT_522071 [Trichonephila clavata]